MLTEAPATTNEIPPEGNQTEDQDLLTLEAPEEGETEEETEGEEEEFDVFENLKLVLDSVTTVNPRQYLLFHQLPAEAKKLIQDWADRHQYYPQLFIFDSETYDPIMSEYIEDGESKQGLISLYDNTNQLPFMVKDWISPSEE